MRWLPTIRAWGGERKVGEDDRSDGTGDGEGRDKGLKPKQPPFSQLSTERDQTSPRLKGASRGD